MSREELLPNTNTATNTKGSAVAPDRYYPELVTSLCAAAGTDTTAVYDALASELRSVDYQPVLIRLSALMAELPTQCNSKHSLALLPVDSSISSTWSNERIDRAILLIRWRRRMPAQR